MGNQISNNKIRQIILLGMIFGFLFLIGFNLSNFLPSFLGAVTLYVIFRDYYFKLTEEKKWKPWLAIGFLMLLSLLVIIVPFYYIAETLVVKLANSREYIEIAIENANQIHQYIKDKTGYDIINSIDIKKVGDGLHLIFAEYYGGGGYYDCDSLFHFIFYAGQFASDGKSFGEGCSAEKI